MSYYILPKKQILHKIHPSFDEPNDPILSFSLLHYMKIAEDYIQTQVQSQNQTPIPEDYNIDFFYKIINPYEFIHNKVPGSKFSVSKIKSSSETFYIFMEIITMFNIFEPFYGRNINTLHCGKNNSSTMECVNLFRENNDDINYEYTIDSSTSEITPIQGVESCSIDLLYFEAENNNVVNLIKILCYILTYQSANGTCVIKLDTLYHKQVLDIVYLLTSLYEKIYIIKPNTSNIFKNERFLICKHFISDHVKNAENNTILKVLKKILEDCTVNKKQVTSLFKGKLPYYFLNKIEESNIIIGHLQLEQYDQLINLIKNKNKEDKIELFKKNNIQKCIQWCEKHKIPYNKFVDKLNIFLPILVCDDTSSCK